MAEGGRFGHFKLILALVLIVGILGLIAYANTGQKFLEKIKIGRFAQTGETKEPFGIVLTTDTTSLYGKSFSINKAVVNLAGVCNKVKIGSLSVERENTRCLVETSDFLGTFYYTPFGSISVSGQVTSVKLDANTYKSDTAINLEVEVIPVSFFVTGLNEPTFSTVASGKIEKYSAEGELKGVAFLKSNSLTINNLIVSAQLENGELKVTGTATSVKSDDFSW